MVWAIKDDAIGNVFLDKAAAEFLLPNLNADLDGSSHQRKTDTIIFKRKKYAAERENSGTKGDFGNISWHSNRYSFSNISKQFSDSTLLKNGF